MWSAWSPGARRSYKKLSAVREQLSAETIGEVEARPVIQLQGWRMKAGPAHLPGRPLEKRGGESKRMPYVNIKITREGATAEQKAQLIRGVTQLLAEILGKNPQTTVVVIDEVETDNWGIGGEAVTSRRQREEREKTEV